MIEFLETLSQWSDFNKRHWEITETISASEFFPPSKFHDHWRIMYIVNNFVNQHTLILEGSMSGLLLSNSLGCPLISNCLKALSAVWGSRSPLSSLVRLTMASEKNPRSVRTFTLKRNIFTRYSQRSQLIYKRMYSLYEAFAMYNAEKKRKKSR